MGAATTGGRALSAEGNTAIVRRFVEAVQHGGELVALDERAAPGEVNHRPPPGVPADRAGLKHSPRCSARPAPMAG